MFIVKLYIDAKEPERVAAAAGFSVRENKIYIFKAKAMVLAAGGAVNVFRPRSTQEGQGRAWYPVWNSGSGYALGLQAGAELTMMENRFVPARFKDGYGPVGAWFLFFKAKATNSLGEDYCVNPEALAEAKKKYGKYVDNLGTAIRNHLMMRDMKLGKGPILMNTHHAMEAINKTFKEKLGDKEGAKKVKHLEAEAWEDFLDMAIGQAGLWAAKNIEPDKVPSEIMPTEPYLLGSHAGCAGFWCCGPDDIGAPEEWNKKWLAGNYNRHVDREGPLYVRRHLRRLGPQVLLRFARRRPHRCKERDSVHARQPGLHPDDQRDRRPSGCRALPAVRGV